VTVEEMAANLKQLGIYWQNGCPGSWEDTSDCPDEWEGMAASECCPQCWMKYGNIGGE
jgi:hypothetical protein